MQDPRKKVSLYRKIKVDSYQYEPQRWGWGTPEPILGPISLGE